MCSPTRQIIYFQTGWPGSVFDWTAFKKTKLNKNPEKYLSEDQYLLGDSGYVLSKKLLTPYKAPEANHAENKTFNELFSSARVIIVHTIGILKNRWSSLRGIRTQVKSKDDFKFVNQWIVACLVLHNWTIRLQDLWEIEDQNDETITPNSSLQFDSAK